MKTINLFFVISLFSFKILAQFSVVQPEVFQLSKVPNYPCPTSDIGKIFYNTTEERMLYCSGTYTTSAGGEYWKGTGNIYYMGSIGIRRGLPGYSLDINGKLRSTIFSADKIGVGNTNPTEKIDLTNRQMAITSSADAVLYKFVYQDAADRFEIAEGGLGRIFMANGGNIGIGSLPNADKLRVTGDANFEGNLVVEGEGIAYNSNATQLKLHIGSFTTSNTFTITNNSCLTTSFTLSGSPFTGNPAVAVGQKTTGIPTPEKLVISVENVVTNSGTVRFCNHSGSTISLSNATFSVIAIGQ